MAKSKFNVVYICLFYKTDDVQVYHFKPLLNIFSIKVSQEFASANK